MGYYPTLKEMEILLLGTTWMNLGNNISVNKTNRERQILMCRIKSGQTQRYREYGCHGLVRVWGMGCVDGGLGVMG